MSLLSFLETPEHHSVEFILKAKKKKGRFLPYAPLRSARENADKKTTIIIIMKIENSA